MCTMHFYCTGLTPSGPPPSAQPLLTLHFFLNTQVPVVLSIYSEVWGRPLHSPASLACKRHNLTANQQRLPAGAPGSVLV